MSRDITVGVLAEIDGVSVEPVILYFGEFSAGDVRFWTGVGPLTWGAATFVGAGNFIGFSEVEETLEVRAVGITVQLNGQSSSLLAIALGQARMGKRGTLWLGFLDAVGALIADPIEVFGGLLDVPSIQRSGETGAIQVSYENRMIGLTVPNERRYTPEDQKFDYPDDTGFDNVPRLQDLKTLPW